MNWRRLLWPFSCLHEHRMFQRDEHERLMLRCEKCGHTVPALKVDADYPSEERA